jgi:membrane protease YdiL (CAAX protease family)
MRAVLRFLTWQRIPVAELRIDRPRFERNLLLAYAIGYIGAAWGTARLILAWPAPLLGAADLTYQTWYVFLFKIGGLLIVPALALRALGYRFRDLAGPRPWSPPTLAAAVIGYGLGLALNLGHVSHQRAALEGGDLDFVPLRVGLGIILPLLSAGIPEEVFFRGLLQTRLEAWRGRILAILLSTSLFTAWHLPTRYFLATGVEGSAGDFGSVLLGTGVPVFIVGLIFSLLWDRHRKLVPLIAAHWGVDTLPAISSLLHIVTSNIGR